MHRDPSTTLMDTFTETFGEHPGNWPGGVQLSVPNFGIVLQCLCDEDLDDDETADFLSRAEAALLVTPPRSSHPPRKASASPATCRPGGLPTATAPPDGYRPGPS